MAALRISAEGLGYWFLRLNGFMTTVNFVVHPSVGADQRTDVDILGVRFPFRREIIGHPMVDSPLFTGVQDRPYVAIAEAKVGRCALNGPWTQSEKRNMQEVLSSVGCVTPSELDGVAESLYTSGQVSRKAYFASLLCFGDSRDEHLLSRYPAVPQVTWSETLEFIHQRFRKYPDKKASHPQWNSDGQSLWDLAMKVQDADAFVRQVEVTDR